MCGDQLRAVVVDQEAKAESTAEEVPKRAGLHLTDASACEGVSHQHVWNEGLEMDKNVKHKMSVTHTGKTHSMKAMKKLSEKHTGVEKSAEHRMKISAYQKRRHAANPAWQATEEAHRDFEGPCGTPRQQTTPNLHFTAHLNEKVNSKQYSRKTKTRAEVRVCHEMLSHLMLSVPARC